MKALILAAGNGTRMQPVTQGRHKALMSLLGLKIIERVILGAKKAGINEFVIVTGYKDNDLHKFLGGRKKYNVSISFVHNNNWEKANGISVLLAKEYFNENFVLLMSDHVFDPTTLIRIQRIKLKKNECVLATDKNLDGVLDVVDTTKVLKKGNEIIDLNKNLKNYNAYDTGMFICSPHIFEVLKKTTSSGKNSLSDGMRVIAKEGNLKNMDNKGNFWADCDTWKDIQFARNKLIDSLTKGGDGLISKYFNRKISTLFSRYLVNTPITPNVISAITLSLSIPAFFMLASGIYPWLIFGGLLIQLMSILDGVDGEIARMKFTDSNWGGFLDAVLDKYVDTVVIVGMTLGYLKITGSTLIIPISLFIIFGLNLDGYMPNKFKVMSGKRLKFSILGFINIKRDLRLLILSLGAIFNLIPLSFVLLLVLLHLKVLIRLISAKQLGK
ncbi:MAG: sugar phosphate nucleotidyltransferase [Candidatus Levyibacteriota bacterium]